jgi:hypothetical protein
MVSCQAEREKLKCNTAEMGNLSIASNIQDRMGVKSSAYSLSKDKGPRDSLS